MHPALLLLLKLRFFAAIRQFKENIKTPKKAVIYLVIILWFFMSFGPSLLMGKHGIADPENGRIFISLGIFAFFLLNLLSSVGEIALHFKPSEIDFLFSAPFARKQLVIFKIILSFITALIPGLIFSMVFYPHSTYWVASFIGVLLAFHFLQLSSMLIALVQQSIEIRLFSRVRKILFFVLISLVLISFYQNVPGTLRWPTLEECKSIYHSPLVTYIIIPFDVFARIITLPHLFPGILLWPGAAIAINLLIIFLILQLDKNFLETSWNCSQKRAARIRNFQSGSIRISSKNGGVVKRTLPVFPWLLGMGPMLWRHCLQLYRSSKFVFIAFIIVPILLGPVLYLLHATKDSQYFLAGGVAYISFILSFSLRNDFRGDLDQISFIKTLPIHPFRIVISEIASPVLLTSLMQWLAILSFWACIGGSWLFFLAIALFIPFVNLTNIAIHNFVFLLFPVRPNQNSAGDMQSFGRGLAFFFMIFLLLLGFFGISGLAGWLMYYLFSNSWFAFGLTAWICLAGFSSLTIPMVWWSYEHFDVADIPSKM